jgi:anhydro-N-acetylmuramic acid kinase
MFTVQPESYNVVGLMSGTSLDGLDICLTNYTSDKTTNRWRYQVIKAQTIAYSPATIGVLRRMPTASLAEYLQLNIEYS